MPKAEHGNQKMAGAAQSRAQSTTALQPQRKKCKQKILQKFKIEMRKFSTCIHTRMHRTTPKLHQLLSSNIQVACTGARCQVLFSCSCCKKGKSYLALSSSVWDVNVVHPHFVCGSRLQRSQHWYIYSIYFKLEITLYKQRQRNVGFCDLFHGECAIFRMFLSISHMRPLIERKLFFFSLRHTLYIYILNNDDSHE